MLERTPGLAMLTVGFMKRMTNLSSLFLLNMRGELLMLVTSALLCKTNCLVLEGNINGQNNNDSVEKGLLSKTWESCFENIVAKHFIHY
jgi:hypothetical protein